MRSAQLTIAQPTTPRKGKASGFAALAQRARPRYLACVHPAKNPREQTKGDLPLTKAPCGAIILVCGLSRRHLSSTPRGVSVGQQGSPPLRGGLLFLPFYAQEAILFPQSLGASLRRAKTRKALQRNNFSPS